MRFLIDSAGGTLSPIGSSPFADLQTAPRWVEISHDGHFLFTVNAGSGTMARYSIARPRLGHRSAVGICAAAAARRLTAASSVR